jgi:dihydrofolate synthase/folylpolyglutamate synthase
MYSSPHLSRINERFQVNGEAISDEDFAGCVTRVKEAADARFSPGEAGLSFFEVLTLAGFCWFRDMGVDILVLETGLGGRLDATNVVSDPLLCVIMSIGLDHTERLGNSIEEIAVEKAGIIKTGRPVIFYCNDDKAYDIIEYSCNREYAELFSLKDVSVSVSESGLNISSSRYGFAYGGLELGLKGGWQRLNAAAVALAVSVLRREGVGIDDGAVVRGLREVRLPCRMDIYYPGGEWEGRAVVLDGAHNESAAKALAASAREIFAGKKITFLVGVSAGKAYGAIMKALAAAADAFVLTALSEKYSVAPVMLAGALDGFGGDVFVEGDYGRAFGLARRATRPGGIVCCAGSLYLAAGIREILMANA